MPDDLGVLLFLPHRELEDRVFAALAEAGFDDVTPAQARVFRRIGRDGSRLAELARAAQVARPTAGFLVDQLERAGYVERTSDPTDARARLIRVAERGLAGSSAGSAAIAEVEREWTAHLGARRMAALRDALTRLGELTEPHP
ncbi:MarR family winged helix-turn-helix transcriptional regulator [Saccharothrix lopnurensis]|uniref:MarR family winged helix-turn-helix transcriptional regulator n=1 Tax=Saccharothrix lopnurensis TaxID=1670621 RepID=A0ABW1P2T5_9PSEU